MKVEKNNVSLISLLFFLFGCLIVTKGLSSSKSVSIKIDNKFERKCILEDAEMNISISKIESQKLISKEFEMRLPPFHMEKENYEDGIIYYYSFTDTTSIVVYEGSRVVFDMDKYKPESTDTLNKRKSIRGAINNKYWRKDVIDGVKVYYVNAPFKNTIIYNQILDSIKIKPRSL